MKIILDAMGGDNAPEAPVLGAVEAAKTYGIEIVLVGRGEDILAVLKKHGIDNLPEGMEISNADDVVDMHDDPASIIHKRKNSSMVIGLKMLAAHCSPARRCWSSGSRESAVRPWVPPCPTRQGERP